jgi:hypothetical protein
MHDTYILKNKRASMPSSSDYINTNGGITPYDGM